MDKQDILTNISDPKQLEKLYREDKAGFKNEFNLIYPEITDNPVADFWNERLNYEEPSVVQQGSRDLIFVILASLLAGLIAKIPVVFNLKDEFFYPRNIGFIFLPILIAYFSWKNKIKGKNLIFPSVAVLAGMTFINFFPADIEKSSTLTLSCIYLPLFMWCVLGYSYVGGISKNYFKRLEFLRYNGDMIILTGLILIAGAILTGLSITLFTLIQIDVSTLYHKYIVVWGLSSAPLVAVYIREKNPNLVSKVTPVLAKIFSPLVLITLVAYLIAIIVTGKDPYNDREFLITFNSLLLGVMAIIFFSVAESFKRKQYNGESIILLALSIVTVIINCIALSAILFRLSSFGISPNRLAVLGSNVLMLINLLMVTYRLYKNVTKRSEISEVENSISIFLPFYCAWTVIVTFIFPLIFSFK